MTDFSPHAVKTAASRVAAKFHANETHYFAVLSDDDGVQRLEATEFGCIVQIQSVDGKLDTLRVIDGNGRHWFPEYDAAPVDPIAIVWDNAPVATKFGQRRVVFDGVVTLASGTVYRVNISATKGGRNPEEILRYSTVAKLGHAVPESMLPAVRQAVREAATLHLAEFRAAYVAAYQAKEAEYQASLDLPELPDYGQDMGAGHNGTPIDAAPVDPAPVVSIRAALLALATVANEMAHCVSGMAREELDAAIQTAWLALDAAPVPLLSLAHVAATNERMATEDKAARFNGRSLPLNPLARTYANGGR